MRQVQVWLGHSTIIMTMRYSHLAPGGDADLIGVLDNPSVRRHGNNAATRLGPEGKI